MTEISSKSKIHLEDGRRKKGQIVSTKLIKLTLLTPPLTVLAWVGDYIEILEKNLHLSIINILYDAFYDAFFPERCQIGNITSTNDFFCDEIIRNFEILKFCCIMNFYLRIVYQELEIVENDSKGELRKKSEKCSYNWQNANCLK